MSGPPGQVTGVAPQAMLVPLRSIESVVQLGDADVMKAIRHATSSGCHVISLSLGGELFFGLEAVINDAVQQNVIVVAAAGNCFPGVVAPANYPNCIAVAATNIHGRPWKGSAHGRKVLISAPGEHVWAACAHAGAPPDALKTGQGTSYAAANIAGVAALWLAHHGRDQLISRYGRSAYLQQVFAEVLSRHKASRPNGFPSQGFGVGIVNAEEVLKHPLPKVPPARTRWNYRPGPTRTMEMMQLALDIDEPALRQQLVWSLGVSDEQLDPLIEDYGPEILDMVMKHPEARPLPVPFREPVFHMAIITSEATRLGLAAHSSKSLKAALVRSALSSVPGPRPPR